jgi:hypothetical protein
MKARPAATLILLLAGALGPAVRSAEAALSPKCASAEHRQFDFWAGDWDAYGLDEGNKLVGRARVDVILDGCALLEVYDQLDGLSGQSFSLYDASRGVWHQSWVTNGGKFLSLDGRFQDGRMTLTGSEIGGDGRTALVRGIWKKAEGGIRETAERSYDGGTTWKPLFDILFRPRPAARTPGPDEKTPTPRPS